MRIATTLRNTADRLPVPGRSTNKSTKLATLRKVGLGGVGALGVAALAFIGYSLVASRYRIGSAAVREIVPTEDGVIVMLHDITFIAPLPQEEDIKAIEAAGNHISYRVDTWKRNDDGLLQGSLR